MVKAGRWRRHFPASLLCLRPRRITFSFGAEETVFQYTRDHCSDYDVPDTPARAIRLADGSLMLSDGDEPQNFALFGPDFNSLHRSCNPTLISERDFDPRTYNNAEWLWAIYREGDIIHAIIHNEYHDPIAPNCSPGNPLPGNPCWYNSLTYARSTDDGRTFTHAAPPQHVLAPAPWVWDPGSGSTTYGYFCSSNIIRGPEDYYYAAFIVVPPTGDQGACMMRTRTLADPSSWRAWDGTDFTIAMTSPYTGPPPAVCVNVLPDPRHVEGNLTYNTYLKKYMMVGAAIIYGTDPLQCGIAYTVSPDLIHWTPLHLMLPSNVPWPPCHGFPGLAYGAVIDHNDSSTNFESAGQNFYLYYTRFNNPYLDRDLVRVPVTITTR